MRFLFRADAGPQIGLGHVQRCLSLAGALTDRGADATFLVSGGENVRDRVLDQGIECRTIDDEPDSEGDARTTISTAQATGAGVLILDSYKIDDTYVGACQDAGLGVAIMDDFGLPSEMANIVIDPSGTAGDSQEDDRILGGPGFAILRPEFRREFRPRVPGPVESVLVTMGGADPMGLTAEVVRILDDLEGDFEVDVVVGPYFGDTGCLENEVNRTKHDVRILRDPESMIDLMERADIACAGAGQTLFELAATGCPTVAVGYVENQRRNINAMAGAILPVWVTDADRSDPIEDAIGLLFTDIAIRTRLSQGALGLVDGRGADRVADQMINLARRFEEIT